MNVASSDLLDEQAAFAARRFRLRDAVLIAGICAVLFSTVTEGDRLLVRFGAMPIPKQLLSLVAMWLLAAVALLHGLVRNRGREFMHIYVSSGAVLVPLSLLSAVTLAGTLLPDAYWDTPGEFLKPLFNLSLVLLAMPLATLPVVGRHYRKIFTILLLIMIASIAVDFVAPGQFSKQTSRGAGVSVQPNFAAKLLVFLTIVRCQWHQLRWWDIGIWLASGLGVFATLSRGGMLLYLAAFTMYLGIWAVRRRFATLVLLCAVCVVVMLLLLAPGRLPMLPSSSMLAKENAQNRIAFFAQAGRGDFSQLRTDRRIARLREYFTAFRAHPIFGRGTGFSYDQVNASHNLYVHYLAENGILGLIGLIIFLVAAIFYFVRRSDYRGCCFMLFLCLAGFHSHSLMEQKSVLALLGFLVGLAASARFAASRSAPNAFQPSYG